MGRRWDVLGALLGLAGSVLDLWLFALFGLDVASLTREPVGWAILSSFVLGYVGLGFAIGRLVLARAQALADKARIASQLAELEESRARVVQSEKLAALGRLAAGIAHEVRNPLGVIRASASMIGEGFAPESDEGRASTFIREEIDRLDGLITALLAFARPARMRPETVSLPSVVERARKLACEGRALRVASQLNVTLPSVRGDADLLTQLVLDLLVNAAEAGASSIEIRAQRSGDRVRVEVVDDGPGIAPDAREKVMEPFFTTKASGTGLGLAMASRIAEAHGGRLELADTPGLEGRGACFAIVLPLEPAALTEAA
jgi:two-component system sensor histidine kinase HydH